MNAPPLGPLLVVGCSVRAAVASARRAGFSPWSLDLFGDADLRAMSPVEIWSDYPQSFPSAWNASPDAPWIYTGGLENHPEWLEKLAATRRLLGNDAAAVRRARDPFAVQQVMAESGLASLVVRQADDPPTAGEWLRKPLRSAGGLHIRPWRADEDWTLPSDAAIYFQQRLPDDTPTFGASFVMASGEARRLGVCRHLRAAGAPLGASARSPYLHGGAATHVLSDEDLAAIDALGGRFADRFRLTGVVGIDVARHDGRWYVLEINPRYPASAQLLDEVGATSVIGLHVAAAVRGELPGAASLRPASPAAFRVAYASRKFAWTAARRAAWIRLAPPVTEVCGELADIPCDGTIIEAGQPVCTFVVRGTADSRSDEVGSVPVTKLETTLASWLAACERELNC